jgi:hypothetical protein
MIKSDNKKNIKWHIDLIIFLQTSRNKSKYKTVLHSLKRSYVSVIYLFTFTMNIVFKLISTTLKHVAIILLRISICKKLID